MIYCKPQLSPAVACAVFSHENGEQNNTSDDQAASLSQGYAETNRLESTGE
jgi:hypothetical protein